MKRCSKCNEVKPLDDFSANRSRKDGKQGFCKACRSAYQKSWYADNQETQYARVAANKLRIARHVYDILVESKCADCPENRPACLQFDHTDPSKKLFNVAQAATLGKSLESVDREIAKCIIRCANCHALRTAEQFGWYAKYDL